MNTAMIAPRSRHAGRSVNRKSIQPASAADTISVTGRAGRLSGTTAVITFEMTSIAYGRTASASSPSRSMRPSRASWWSASSPTVALRSSLATGPPGPV